MTKTVSRSGWAGEKGVFEGDFAVDIDFAFWAKKYREGYEGEIEYKERSGRIRVERSPTFERISRDLRRKGYLEELDFVNICSWKTKRQKKRYAKNSRGRVEKISRNMMAGQRGPEELIKELIELNGVGVPVATAIMTVVFPQKYCIVDYRASRAFLWLVSRRRNFGKYREYLSLMDRFRNYASVEFYAEYLEKIKRWASKRRMTAREVEMALWKYDEEEGKAE